MAIEIIDTLGQKNNGEFPLVDSNDIKGGFYQVDTVNERDLIPSIRRKEGMLCAVKNDKVYQLVGGIGNEYWVVFNAGSGGGFSGDYNDLTNKPIIPVVDVDKEYVDSKLSRKVDNVILTDDNSLDFYADDILVKSIKIEGGSQIDSSEIEELKNTKIDDVIVDAQDGVTYIKFFANDEIVKTIEIKTSSDSLIHVGADEPIADNCEVWVDVSDDEEFSSKIEDSLVTEIRIVISTLQSEIDKLKKIIVAHEARIEYLELNGGGSSGGSGGEDNDGSDNITTKFIPLAFEGGEVLILEDGTILTLEDINY